MADLGISKLYGKTAEQQKQEADEEWRAETARERMLWQMRDIRDVEYYSGEFYGDRD